jgi:D-alanine-D-alanine ligase
MKKVGVIFGGVTCEHDVSIVTGIQLIENIDKSKYEVYPIYIHSDGEWYVGNKLLDQKIYKDFDSVKIYYHGYVLDI